MKILVLAAEQSIGHADGRRSRRIASLLGDAHEVETISLFGTVEAGGLHPATRALVHRTKSGDEPIRAHSLRTEVIASAVATTSASLPGHHILAESELRLALRSLDVDLVILTEPTLTDFARQALDPTVAMAVVIDDPTAVVPDLVVADALIVPGPESANTVAEALGSLSPHIHVVPPHAWHTSTESPKDTVIAAVGSAPDRDVLGSVVDAFVELFPSNSEWSLNLASTGSEASALQLRAELAGVHGAVASSSRELMENDVLCRAAAIIVAAHDVGDAMASVLNGVACGSRVIVSTDNPDVEQLIREAPGAEPWTGSASRHIADILTTGPARIHDSSTKDWLQHWRRHAEQALLIAVDDVANVEDDNRIETLAERTLQARHRTEQAPPDSASSQSVRPLEDKLSGRHAGLVRWSGTLNEEHDSLLEPDVLARNLAFVASSLRAANIEFVVVSSPHEPGRIAVDAGLGRSAVEAIRAHGADVLVYTEHVDLTGQRRNRTLASASAHGQRQGEHERTATHAAHEPTASRKSSTAARSGSGNETVVGVGVFDDGSGDVKARVVAKPAVNATANARPASATVRARRFVGDAAGAIGRLAGAPGFGARGRGANASAIAAALGKRISLSGWVARANVAASQASVLSRRAKSSRRRSVAPPTRRPAMASSNTMPSA